MMNCVKDGDYIVCDTLNTVTNIIDASYDIVLDYLSELEIDYKDELLIRDAFHSHFTTVIDLLNEEYCIDDEDEFVDEELDSLISFN